MQKLMIVCLVVALSACNAAKVWEPTPGHACFVEWQAVEQIVKLRNGAEDFTSLMEIEDRRRAELNACMQGVE